MIRRVINRVIVSVFVYFIFVVISYKILVLQLLLPVLKVGGSSPFGRASIETPKSVGISTLFGVFALGVENKLMCVYVR